MEDAHINVVDIGPNKNVDVFGVFDGHGGKEVAQFVRIHFVESLEANENFKKGNYKDALKENFLNMDVLMRTPEGKAELSQLAIKSKQDDDAQEARLGTQGQNSQMDMIMKMLKAKDNDDVALMTGCTSCVCLVDHGNNKLYFANAGDSRAVLCKKGNAYAMSIDHKPELDVEKNRIYKADGFISEGRVKGNLNLSRGLGDLEYKNNTKLPPEEQMITANPDIAVEELNKDCDFMIIGCDGIWDCLTNQAACDFVKQRLEKDNNIKLSKVVEEMMDSIIATDIYNETGVGCDNMTCMVIQFLH
ncbi:MAG: protein phosphatase 2C domain-containing protein [archaeon]|nr:protein phosphatase 2C domain-containing protein [archaeon]